VGARALDQAQRFFVIAAHKRVPGLDRTRATLRHRAMHPSFERGAPARRSR
jgi:hypothetical protein